MLQRKSKHTYCVHFF